MDINIDGIKNYLEPGYQITLEQTGRLKDHTVKFLNQALAQIRQDSRLAGITVFATNILFLEIAYRIGDLVYQGQVYFFGPGSNWSDELVIANGCVAFSIFSASLVGMNVALYKGLKLPLRPIEAAAIGTITNLVLFYFR